MATFVVCTRCGTTRARCSVKEETEDGTVGDILDEEVIYPHPGEDTLDEGFEDECAICRGPCQGH